MLSLIPHIPTKIEKYIKKKKIKTNNKKKLKQFCGRKILFYQVLEFLSCYFSARVSQIRKLSSFNQRKLLL